MPRHEVPVVWWYKFKSNSKAVTPLKSACGVRAHTLSCLLSQPAVLVIFSDSRLKVKCRSVLEWPGLILPRISHLLPQSASLMWDLTTGQKGNSLFRDQQHSISAYSDVLDVIRGELDTDDRLRYGLLIKNILGYQQR